MTTCQPPLGRRERTGCSLTAREDVGFHKKRMCSRFQRQWIAIDTGHIADAARKYEMESPRYDTMSAACIQPFTKRRKKEE